MNSKLRFLILLIVILASCQTREWVNPFSADCPKDIWTPTNFIAIQEGITIKITWNQPINQISGFKIQKGVDGASAVSLPDQAKGINQLIDNTLVGGKAHVYTLTAYAGNNLSNTVTVSITPVLTASITTTAVSAITSNTIGSGGTITIDGGVAITARGVCWSINQNPTTADSKTTNGTGSGSFTSSITGLSPGTTYNIRAYATNSAGTAYGNQVTATTAAILPTITTTAISALTATTATSGGNITSDGGASVTARGVCWSTTQNPTIANYKTADGVNIGSYTSIITGLIPGTTYYIKAYATNSVGTVYGNEITTTATALLPVLTTTAISVITSTTSTSGGNITSDGGSTVTARGVCWSTTSTPTIANSKTSDGLGIGTFVSAITGLTAGTTYYVRAYATNITGTNYGNEVSFTALANLPTLTTTVGSVITSTTATSGGIISADGGATVTARGICWSTASTPTIANNKTSDGSGIGTFVSAITGLTAGTTYYVRAYATNTAGTGYGNQISFIAIASIPTLTTTVGSAITSTTATSGGIISADGGATVTARGVCWSTTSTPTIANSKTSDGSGIGTFASAITGLTAGTTYYARSYATNSAGTGYGNQITFIALANLPTLTTTAISAITSTTATSGGIISSDGGAAVTARGVCWSTASTPTIANSKTIEGSGIGTFVCTITGLTAGTTYFARAYATNSVGTKYGSEVSFKTIIAEPLFNSTKSYGSVTDIDGNVYKTIVVGTQTWMAENLKTTTYKDGTPISPVTDNAVWAKLTTGGYSWYNNDATNYKSTYGALYNWYTVGTAKLCPTGWRVPTDADWTTLGNYLGGISLAGGKLKELGTSHWLSPNTGATNESGFTALSGGGRSATDGTFNFMGNDGNWWSSQENSATVAYNMSLYNGSSNEYTVTNSKAYGYSVRCISDPLSLPTLTTNSISGINYNSATSGGIISSDGGSAVTARGVCWSTSPSPTIANSKSTDGTLTGSYVSVLIGLTASTTYYVRAYATTSAGTSYGSQVSFITSAAVTSSTVTDIDGNVYKTVTIGAQVWMAENLKTTKYRNGELISNVTDGTAWTALTSGAYCWYNNDATTNKATYGALYNWYAVSDTRNIAPIGWHIATDTEWVTLTNFLGGGLVSSGKLKEAGTTHWSSPNTDATNESGFTALPAGLRFPTDGMFANMGFESNWWTSEVYNTSYAWYRGLNYLGLGSRYYEKQYGFSIRCVRD